MKFVFMALLFFLPLEMEESNLTLVEEDEIIELVDRQYYAIPFTNNLFIDEAKLEKLLSKMNAKVSKQPINAMINEKGTLVEEVPGISLNKQAFIESFFNYFYGSRPTTIEIPKLNVYPRVSSELLAEIYVKNVGSYRTFYDESNYERSHNISLSTEAINNYVVFPGEEFSFNKVVGERTEAKGYLKAPVIVRGELAEDIGGGICQVSSTLFNAVNLKGVVMIERYSHSRQVPYVPPGKDATVSWWGPDFVFKNNYSDPLLIRATSKNGKMEINIFSAEHVHTKQ